MSDKPSTVQSAGRGLVFIASAKVYFIVSSYVVHLALPRLLGSPESYGQFATAMSAASILNNVLIAATIQTFSKLVSEDEQRAPFTLRQGLKIQVVVGGSLAAVAFLLAPTLGEWLLRDPELTPLLQIVSSIFLVYALYAGLVGSLNGRRLFSRQAGLDATFSTLRTGGILGGAVLGTAAGMGALGALGGFAAAATGVLVTALVVVGVGRSGEPLPLRRWTSFMGPIGAFQLFLNLMLLSDVLVLKNTVSMLAADGGATASEAAAVASEYVGYYSAAQKFALVPYQLMLSITFIVFPLISRATTAGDTEAARSTIRGAMRFSLLVLLSIAAPISGAADGVMRVAFPAEYLVGAGALSVLVFGAAAFALFVITATVMSGAGRPQVAMVVGFFGLLAVVGGNRLFVQMVGIGDLTPMAAAAGTTAGMVLALLLGAAVMYRAFHAFLPVASMVRAAIAAAVGFGVAHYIPHASAVMALVALAGGFLSYLATLAALRELRRADLEVAFSIVKRRRG